jgi:hypothetical protein
MKKTYLTEADHMRAMINTITEGPESNLRVLQSITYGNYYHITDGEVIVLPASIADAWLEVDENNPYGGERSEPSYIDITDQLSPEQLEELASNNIGDDAEGRHMLSAMIDAYESEVDMEEVIEIQDEIFARYNIDDIDLEMTEGVGSSMLSWIGKKTGLTAKREKARRTQLGKERNAWDAENPSITASGVKHKMPASVVKIKPPKTAAQKAKINAKAKTKRNAKKQKSQDIKDGQSRAKTDTGK